MTALRIGPKVASALAVHCHSSLCFHGHPRKTKETEQTAELSGL